MLKEDIIERATAEWESRIVFARKWRWFGPGFCRPLKVKRHTPQKLSCSPPNGKMHQLAGSSAHLLNFWFELGLLTGLQWKSRPRRDHIYQLLRPVTVHMDNVQTDQCTRHLPRSNGRYLVLSEMEVGSCLLRRYHFHFEDSRTTSQPSSICSDATARCRRNN